MRRRHVEVTLFIPVYVVLLLETLVFFAWLGLVHKGFTLNEEAKLLAIIVGLVVFLASVVMTFLQSRLLRKKPEPEEEEDDEDDGEAWKRA